MSPVSVVAARAAAPQPVASPGPDPGSRGHRPLGQGDRPPAARDPPDGSNSLREPVSGPRHPQPVPGDRGLVRPPDGREAAPGGRMPVSEAVPAELHGMPGLSGNPDGDARHLPPAAGIGPHLPSPGEPAGAEYGLPLVWRLRHRRRRGPASMEQ